MTISGADATGNETASAAGALAALGRYDAALALLDHSDDGPDDLAASLVRAKIAAQRGNLDEAIGLWEQVLARDPANTDAQRGLAAARDPRQRHAPLLTPSRLATAAVAGLVLLLSGVAVVTGIVVGNRSGAATRTAFVEMQQRYDALAGDLGVVTRRLESRAEASVARPAEHQPTASTASMDVGARVKDVPGIQFHEGAGGGEITFPTGLFASGAVNPSPTGTATISALGRVMQPLAGRIHVRIDGHTDDVPPAGRGAYPDNVAVGFARATAVALALRGTSGFSSDAFTLGSAADAAPLVPNDGTANRARNRTVVILLTPTS